MPPRSSSRHRASPPPSPLRRRRIVPLSRPATEEATDHPTLLHEEKRRLILAHAQARRERPKGLGFIHYIAITASCLIVMVGWWMTMERSFALSSAPSASSGSFTQILEQSVRSADEQQKRFFPPPIKKTSLDKRLEEAQDELRNF